MLSIGLSNYIFVWCAYLATFIFNFILCNSLHHCLHPSSIQCRGLNPRPLGHEPSALTTRPLLLAYQVNVLYIRVIIYLTSLIQFNRLIFSNNFLPSSWIKKRNNKKNLFLKLYSYFVYVKGFYNKFIWFT